MIVNIRFQLDNSIYFYEGERPLFYMSRKSSFGNTYGEIRDFQGKTLIKTNTSFLGKIKILFQDLNPSIDKQNSTYILSNGDKIRICNFFLFFGKIYFNNNLIGKIKYTKPFKYNITLELDYRTNDSFQIYYSSIIYCITLLNVNLY